MNRWKKPPFSKAPPLGGCPQSGQGEIPLLGEMSAERTKGSAVFAEEAVSGEEGVRRTEGCHRSLREL